ncbi:MAG: hypothetical protein JOZ18_01485 [Chloroflexi bacterium]|nr:hypothetical protein [Chloroflexota bacterium]
MLLLKLLLTPLFVGLISLAGRRWGSQVSGWLVGLPLTSAPITVFLTLEQGTTFASHVAQGILLGLLSQAVFCVTYAWLSFRINWLSSWLIGWAMFLATTLVLEQISAPLPLIFVAVVSSLFLILLLWPKQRAQAVEIKSTAWEIAGRIVIATSFVLGLTSAAPVLGPHLSGLLSPLPIYATIFAIFTHKFQGATSARQVLHGVMVSSFACAVFFLLVAGLAERWSIIATFSTATLCALLTQGCTLWLLNRCTPAA